MHQPSSDQRFNEQHGQVENFELTRAATAMMMLSARFMWQQKGINVSTASDWPYARIRAYMAGGQGSAIAFWSCLLWQKPSQAGGMPVLVLLSTWQQVLYTRSECQVRCKMLMSRCSHKSQDCQGSNRFRTTNRCLSTTPVEQSLRAEACSQHCMHQALTGSLRNEARRSLPCRMLLV